MLLYVCVNVKRGQGRLSSGRHYAHTVTAPHLDTTLPLTAALSFRPAAPPSPERTRPRYKLGYLATEGPLPPIWRHGAWLVRYLLLSLWVSTAGAGIPALVQVPLFLAGKLQLWP